MWRLSDKRSQTEKDKYQIILYVESKKNRIQMNLSKKQKQTHRLKRMTFWFPAGKGGRRTEWEFGTDMYTTLYLKHS